MCLLYGSRAGLIFYGFDFIVRGGRPVLVSIWPRYSKSFLAKKHFGERRRIYIISIQQVKGEIKMLYMLIEGVAECEDIVRVNKDESVLVRLKNVVHPTVECQGAFDKPNGITTNSINCPNWHLNEVC